MKKEFIVSIKDNVSPYGSYSLTTSLEWTDGFGDNCLFNSDEFEYIKEYLIKDSEKNNYCFDIIDFESGKTIYSK